MMTGMERLAAVKRGAPTDRIPVFCNLLEQGARASGVSIEEYYRSGERVAAAQLAMREKHGYDNVWAFFYAGKEAELFRCRAMVFAKDGPPNIGDLVIRSPKDIARLTVPSDLASHPAFEEVLICLRILRREAGGKHPICVYVTASMTLPALLMGMEKWMELLMLGPAELRDELLTKCSEFTRRELRTYREAGADMILYANPFGSTDLMPKRFVETMSIPWMERDLAESGTAGVIYYCNAARENDVIEPVLERVGFDAFYLSPLDDIAEAKRRVAGRALTFGILNDIRLVDWSRDEIRAEVKRIIEAGKPGGRFLFGTLLMPYAIPEENIRTMLEAAYELGRCD